MMRQAQKMQQQVAQLQEELATREVTASVGGGKVTVTASASGEILKIQIAPEVVDPEDVEMLEDLILSGVRQALAEGQKLQKDEMGKVTAGLGLPPGLAF
ncbi:MAG: YbaB/EbfC family nucleoid-associated protein [Verrucomicrobiia bacterium]